MKGSARLNDNSRCSQVEIAVVPHILNGTDNLPGAVIFLLYLYLNSSHSISNHITVVLVCIKVILGIESMILNASSGPSVFSSFTNICSSDSDLAYLNVYIV